MTQASTSPILRITQPTFLKRRVASSQELGPDEKVAKGPCRIPLESYAEQVAGEDLQGHYKVTFAGPYMGSKVWYIYKGHSLIEGGATPQAPQQAKRPLVLRITQPTYLKRRIAPVQHLAPHEKVAKGPCRIFLHSYAYQVPGEDLQGHLKVCFEGPIMGNSSVWYIYKGHCLIEGNEPPEAKTSGPTRINQAGLDLIKSFEGLRTQAYICPAGVPTIGYGSTVGVKMGDRITPEQAEALLRKDLERFEAAVRNSVKVPLKDNQFSALVSFAFNVGIGAFQKSTMLKLLNQGNYMGAAQEFPKWNKAGGRVLPGLTRRRQAEQSLFLRK